MTVEVIYKDGHKEKYKFFFFQFEKYRGEIDVKEKDGKTKFVDIDPKKIKEIIIK